MTYQINTDGTISTSEGTEVTLAQFIATLRKAREAAGAAKKVAAKERKAANAVKAVAKKKERVAKLKKQLASLQA